MLRQRTSRSRGFTLVELSIATTIVGVLMALGTFGVRRYVGQAYTAEAIQNVGGIRRAVIAAAAMKEKIGSTTTDTQTNTGSSGGGKSGNKGGNKPGNNGGGAEVTHGVAEGLCSSADPVPEKFEKVQGKKYQPTAGDYRTGNSTTGWRCLGFTISTPQAYQYGYDLGGPKVQVELPHGGNPPGLEKGQTWTAWARGDRNGDGQVSWFVMTGAIMDGTVYAPPGVGIVDEAE